MRRREFLKLSTAGAAALALPDANLLALNLNLPVGHAAGAPASVAAAGLPRLAVAFCAQATTSAGVPHSTARATLLGARLVAADTLRSGDARLARDGAHVTLSGVVPDGSALSAARVLVDFQPFHATPFHAWSYGAGAAAKPIAFTVPVDAAAGLNLWVDVRRADEATTATSVLRFAIGDDAGAAKLRAGTYVITLDEAAGALRDYGLARVDGAPLGLYRGDAPAGHAHLLMTIA